MKQLLSLLLRERPPAVVVGGDAGTFWAETRGLRARFATQVERAVASGYVADRLGLAFVGGYQAAVHALVPAVPPDVVASFCVSEEKGNHPRAIESVLSPAPSGYVLSGAKRWSTMAPLAEVLVVVARAGEQEGRPVLRAALVEQDAPGVSVTPMPEPPFVPEVPHAALTLESVAVDAAAVLPGDGYTDYTKAFRTVEDLHVNAALLGYLLSLSARHGLSSDLQERLVALVVGAVGVAQMPALEATTHVALAGLLGQVAALGEILEPELARVTPDERDRWYRDRALVQVAEKARKARRERAWQALVAPGAEKRS